MRRRAQRSAWVAALATSLLAGSLLVAGPSVADGPSPVGPITQLLPVIPDQPIQQAVVAADASGLEIVAVDTRATNFMSGDTNNLDDVYLFNTGTVAVGGFAPGQVRRVTVGPSGEQVFVSSGELVPGDASIKIDPTGQYLVIVTRASLVGSGGAGLTRISIHDIAAGTTSEVGSSFGAVRPAVSGDGRLVAFFTPNELRVYNRLTGATTTVLSGITPGSSEAGSLGGIALSADGDMLLFTSASDHPQLPHPWKNQIGSPLTEALYAVPLDPAGGTPTDPSNPAVAVDGWVPSNGLDLAIANDGEVRYRERDWLGCECDRSGAIRWRSQVPPYTPSTLQVGQTSTANAPLSVAMTPDGALALLSMGLSTAGDWGATLVEQRPEGPIARDLDLTPLSPNSLRPIAVSAGRVGYVLARDGSAGTTAPFVPWRFGLDPSVPPPSVVLTADFTSGRPGTGFTLRYNCTGYEPALHVYKAAGEANYTAGLLISHNGTDYVQGLTLISPGSWQISVVCGPDESNVVTFAVLPPCGDAAVLGVRGSGDNEHPDYDRNYPGHDAVRVAELLQQKWHLALYDDDGHSEGAADGSAVNVIGVKYKAVAVTLPTLPEYPGSQKEGKEAVLAEITRLRQPSVCGPLLPIVAVGLSQGAHSIQSALDTLAELSTESQPLAGAALIASPRFDASDPTSRGTFVADASAGGILGASLVPAVFRETVRSWCLVNDSVCTGYKKDNAFHGFYGDDILEDAAGLLANDILRITSRSASAYPTGDFTAYDTNKKTVRFSAAAIYARGAPSVTFSWDFDSNGQVDEVTARAWTTHAFSNREALKGSAKTTVTVLFADKSVLIKALCITKTSTPC